MHPFSFAALNYYVGLSDVNEEYIHVCTFLGLMVSFFLKKKILIITISEKYVLKIDLCSISALLLLSAVLKCHPVSMDGSTKNISSLIFIIFQKCLTNRQKRIMEIVSRNRMRVTLLSPSTVFKYRFTF